MNNTITSIIDSMRNLDQIGSSAKDDKTYEYLFKALATQTTGSLLFNENPIDAIYDMDENDPLFISGMKLAEDQKRWLKELGLDNIAENWI